MRPSCRNCSIAHRQCDWPSTSDLYDRRHRRPSGSSTRPYQEASSTTCTSPGDKGATWLRTDDVNVNVNDSDLDLLLLAQCDSGGAEDETSFAQSLSLSSSSPWHLSRHDYAFHQAGFNKNPVVQTTIRSDLEVTLFQYFSDYFLSVLMLRNAHPGFYADYRTCIGRLILNCDSVKCAILACCASNRYMLDSNPSLREVSLRYYTQAVRQVNRVLATSDWACESPSDHLLTTVIFLYINALWGPDLEHDASKHVAGAMHLLKLRYSSNNASSSLSMTRPFDRITAESVLYQAFLLSMRRPFAVDFQIDHHFLASTEHILESPTFQDASSAANSPVLGVPLPLYRLILDVIHLGNSPHGVDAQTFSKLKREMKYWETVAIEVDDDCRISQSPASTLCPPSPPHQHPHPHPEALALYVLAGSLLLDWMVDFPEPGSTSDVDISSPQYGRISSLGVSQSRPTTPETASSYTPFDSPTALPPPPPPPPPLSTRSWQLSRALEILHRPSTHETWTRSFLGWWPLLIFGYVVTDDDDIEQIKSLLRCMRRRIGYGVVESVLYELEAVWQSRRTADDTGITCEAYKISTWDRSLLARRSSM
ncbi:hypothetical protein LTR55_010249 [Exophiala xenobiotica]|nr:hypothetical protein LTR14_007834 [Exophiala xenobiotica]KAK5473714.1 hypothetical protein LTR55_010249 [Exophiala xenobiotica]